MATTASTEEHDNNFEVYSLVWLDSAVNKAKEYIEAQKKLRKLINYLKTFDDVDQCELYTRSVSQGDRIIFITTNKLGQEFVPRIHSLGQIFTIYIYCPDNKQSNDWTKKFDKVNEK
jgi:hypothetical protein